MRRPAQRTAERAHAEVSMSGLRSLCATPAAAAQGVVAMEVGGALALRTRAKELELNRVVGLGLWRPATRDDLDDLDRTYGHHGLPYVVHLHPGAEPADLSTKLIARRFETFPPWSVLGRGGAPLPAPDRGGSVRVERAEMDDADEVARILGLSFGQPVGAPGLLGATVGVAGWHHYLAFIGAEAVGAAAMHLSEGACLFGGSGTLIDHRRRGVQSALIDRRIRDAIAGGCHALFVETGSDLASEEPPELRQLIRAGFAPAFSLRSFGYRRGVKQRYDPTTRTWR